MLQTKNSAKDLVESEKRCKFAAVNHSKKGNNMSTQALSGLRDYLTGTLSPSNMLWLSAQLADYAKKHETPVKRYTIEEINIMLDKAEADFAAGKGIPHEEVMREWDEEIVRMEQEEHELEISEAV